MYTYFRLRLLLLASHYKYAEYKYSTRKGLKQYPATITKKHPEVQNIPFSRSMTNNKLDLGNRSLRSILNKDPASSKTS